MAGPLVFVVVVAGGAAWAASRDPAPSPSPSSSRSRGGPVADGVVPKEPGTPVELPSTGWRPGDDAAASALQSRLELTDEGCVVAVAPGRTEADGVALLWPAGWTAQRDTLGRVEVLAPGGAVILREGDEFQVGGGGYGGTARWVCGESPSGVFEMNEIPEKLG